MSHPGRERPTDCEVWGSGIGPSSKASGRASERRSSWSWFHTVWYESIRGDVNQSFAPSSTTCPYTWRSRRSCDPESFDVPCDPADGPGAAQLVKAFQASDHLPVVHRGSPWLFGALDGSTCQAERTASSSRFSVRERTIETHERLVSRVRWSRPAPTSTVRGPRPFRAARLPGPHPHEFELDELRVTFECRLVEHSAQSQLVERRPVGGRQVVHTGHGSVESPSGHEGRPGRPVSEAIVRQELSAMAAKAWIAPDDVDAVTRGSAAHDYLADPGLATAIFLALRMRRPLLLEGEAGVGKTEVAKVLATWPGRRCPAAVLRGHRRRPGASTSGTTPGSCSICGRSKRRPRHGATRTSSTTSASLCAARYSRRSRHDASPPVLLIDEIDRADDDSRRFCSRSSPSRRSPCPSSARSAPTVPPIVVLTSNRTRDVHDALKRRCLYHWIEHPDFERELAIVRLRAPEVSEELAGATGRGAVAGRATRLYKPPGVAETIDWARHSRARRGAHRRGARSTYAGHGAEVPRRPGACAGARYRPTRARTRVHDREPDALAFGGASAHLARRAGSP